MKVRYKILEVDYNNKSMMVKYFNENGDEFLAGCKIPYEDEDLENVLSDYAPRSDLIPKNEKKLKNINVNASGTIEIFEAKRENASVDDLEALQAEQIKTIVESILSERGII